MAFTYGFFNSLRGDRKYNAEQVSEIFDGILADGIIPTVGGLFAVTTANNGMQINVASGRAWFNHTWSKNDSTMILTVPQSDITRPRYDAVVLEVNHEQDVRANAIKIVTGVPAINTVKPILINNEKVHQYPLAYILVPAAATEIRAQDIENAVGLSPTVFATGILETAPLDDLWAQWKGEFDEWFAAIKLQLSGDIVTNLQYQIDQLKDSVKNIQEMIKIEEVVHTEIITASGTWRNQTTQDIDVMVRIFGGGGGAFMGGSYYCGGGGGGYMNIWRGTITKGSSVPVTIGMAGTCETNTAGNGGTTSFGTYASANGGGAGARYAAGNGGTGGGGPRGNGGGNAVYGGGGGAGSGAKGGNGGTYGGGGGGGGGTGKYYPSSSGTGGLTWSAGGEKGSAGQYGGAGGNGGDGESTEYEAAKDGSSGSSGVNTNGTTNEFKGPGSGGSKGLAATYSDVYNRPSAGGGGGGGGGGYGGNGGNGGNGKYVGDYASNNAVAYGGGGGGGGGYGANGGGGASGSSDSAGGGGGGGYGGVGRDGHGAFGGGGGGYGANNYGAGATGYYNSDSSTSKPSMPGVCIITYTTRELIVG